MAVRVVHVMDETTAEDNVRLLSMLWRRMPASRVSQHVIAIGPPPGPGLPEGVSPTRVGRCLGWPPAAALELRRTLRRHAPQVVLAWSASAAAVVAGAWRPDTPVVVTLCDPADADRSSRWYRSLESAGAQVRLLCASGLVQRRVVEAGIPMSSTAIIRPGVDFGALREARQRLRREDLGLPPDACVLLTPSPPTPAGGHFQGAWAAALLYQIRSDIRVVVPGHSREQQRIGRLVARLPFPGFYCPVGYRFAPEVLLAAADLLVVPARDDVPAGWLAGAMCAGVPIVGTAVPAVTEFIADRHNGFLARSGEPHTLAIRIRAALEADDQRRACAQTARDQAYDVFRAQRCVDEYLRVIDNLTTGEPALAGVRDAALDT